jgi:uridine phosphorylase
LTAHLRPTAPIAADVLLPGDPALALALAQALFDRPLMSNHSHGLWGYWGRTATGRELTIQASGIGGPSAAVVLAELAGHGARRVIRLGGCSALEPALAVGSPLVAAAALAADGASRALSVPTPEPEPGLTAALASAARARPVTVASADLFHDPERAERRARWLDDGAVVADLESAAVLAVGARLGLDCAAALVVAEDAEGRHDERATELGLIRLGEAAAETLEAARVAQPAGS